MTKYRILDLFSGAGGFSLGLDNINSFETVLATDLNHDALVTFKENFRTADTILGDITQSSVKDEIISTAKEKQVNMIIGGPPCQGFSNKGKKLGLEDPRNYLFIEFLHIVEEIKPELFIIENVKTMLTASDGYFIKEINQKIKELGYLSDYSILNSVNFGVPQNRERAFIIAHKNKALSLPKNNEIRQNTVYDAISDLAFLESGEGEFKSSYLKRSLSKYQDMMREKSNVLYNHVATKHSKETLYKLSLIPPEKGKEYIPVELHGKQKFKTTWSRLEWDKPSPTIDTRFDTPSNGKNSHPFLNRAITQREAARIQSFPDHFVFYGNKTSICTQIGNAVPPLMAKAIGEAIITQLNNKTVYEQNGVKLYNNDSYKIVDEFIKSEIKVDHIITDPPYNISKENNFSTMTSAKRQGVNFGEWDFNFDLYSWIENYRKLLKKDGSIIIFCSYRFISYIIDALESYDFEVKDILKWVKSNPMPRNINRRYVQDTEYAVWAVNKQAKWVFNKPSDVSYLRPEFKTSTVSGKERTIHPTQKSLKLMEDIISIHTNEGQIILDPFMGSGTTGVAARNLNRNFIGVEIEKTYFDISIERISRTENINIFNLLKDNQ